MQLDILVSALGGAIVGGLASIAGVFIQARFQSKRELAKEAINLALTDWRARHDHLEKKGSGALMPISVYVHYHTELLRLAQRRKLTPETVLALHQKQERLIEAIETAEKRVAEAEIQKRKQSGA